ncbi:MAG: fibrobacter succinogenes major paralogous domain-containing protein [Flavobacteriaceae bacterium]
MEKILQRVMVLLVALGMTSCSQEENTKQENPANRPTLPITASQVTIGSQVWMTKNLDVNSYRNGDPIPQVQDPTAWANLTTGAWCYYENSTANGTTYGKLYNGYAIMDPRGLAPYGWHIPSNDEWTTLQNELGGNTVAGGKMKATTLWLAPNTGATNSSGFTALPGGARGSGGMFFGPILNAAYWWSSADVGATSIWQRQVQSDWGGLTSYLNTNIRHGFSVRCIKDVATTNNTVTDIDGNHYNLVTIGNQIWTQSNLNVSRYRNGDPIPQATLSEWSTLTSGAWCYYANNTINGPVYGKLYNWYAVNDPRGLAPVGYHIPSDAEWTTLTTFLGGEAVAGGKMKARTGWIAPNTSATNSSGFTGRPAGYLDYDGALAFNLFGYYTYYWSSSEFNNSIAWTRSLNYNFGVAYRFNNDKKNGFSVRCLKD